MSLISPIKVPEQFRRVGKKVYKKGRIFSNLYIGHLDFDENFDYSGSVFYNCLPYLDRDDIIQVSTYDHDEKAYAAYMQKDINRKLEQKRYGYLDGRVDLTRLYLRGVDFESMAPIVKSLALNSILHVFAFQGSDLEGCSFKGWNYAGIDFTGCNMNNTNFSDTKLDRVYFENVSLNNSNFMNSKLDECYFRGYYTSAEHINFTSSVLKDCVFTEVELVGSVWSKSLVLRGDFRSANLSRSDLSKVEFDDCAFNNAEIYNSDMSNSIFKNSRFLETELVNTNMSKSNFTGCDFYEAEIEGCDVEGSIFKDAVVEDTSLDGKVQT